MRYKNILKIMQGMAFKSSEYVDSSSVINIRMGNIKKGGSIDLNHNTKYLPENYKSIYRDYELRKGDTIIAMTDMSPTLDFLAVPAILDFLDANSTYLLNQRVGKLILNRDYEIRFVRYLLLSENLRIQLKAKGLGTVQANMSNDDLYSSYLFCPPSVERLNIANFLDHETAKIDHLIEKQQQLIELLKEKRQAVISHAVTKGLDPNVPMKDSGVEWLGEVPEHWSVAKIKHLSKIISKGTTPTTIGGDFVFEGIRFLKAENIGKKPIVNSSPEFFITENVDAQLARSRLQEHDVLVIIAGATTGLSSVLQKELLPANTNQAVSFIRPKETEYAKWISYWLSTHFAQSLIWMGAVQAAQPNLSMESLGNIDITLPSVEEIKTTLDFIDTVLLKIDDLIEKNIKAIDFMQERRTALISAAVTGKIDVRHWQAPTVAEADTELSA
ncbi:restriction endonuclease subunit S [Acinetobacter cumulans]|uniref:restriction endonuclease subunit S n=1 Tax=Acinetobacter cumulans TaxID=2136182 RepID=UPI0011C345EB